MADTEAARVVVDERTVRALFSTFNDRKAFFAHPDRTWVERPHYRIYAQNLEMHTREEVLAWFQGFFDAMLDLHMDVEDVAVAGEPGRERVTVRWHLSGTFSGAPYMGIEPTGRSLELYGIDLIDLQDGRVAANNVYYDQSSFARQIGMLPADGRPRTRRQAPSA